MSYPPVKFRALMRLVALAPLLGGGIAVPSFAATDPLVLSNDAGGRPVSSLRATSLYWDVKQMDDVGMDAPRMCRVAKTMPDGSILAPRVGVMSVPSIDVTSSKLALPKTATVRLPYRLIAPYRRFRRRGKLMGLIVWLLLSPVINYCTIIWGRRRSCVCPLQTARQCAG